MNATRVPGHPWTTGDLHFSQNEFASMRVVSRRVIHKEPFNRSRSEMYVYDFASFSRQMIRDITYIPTLENERRAITDVPALRRLAQHLGLPHRLGLNRQGPALGCVPARSVHLGHAIAHSRQDQAT